MSDFFSELFSAIAGPLLLISGLFVVYKVFEMVGIELETSISIIFALSPLWLPITLLFVLHYWWMEYVHLKFILYNGRTTLRIHLPQEVYKSPEAMENVMTQIHNVQSIDNLMQTYLDGKHALHFSFELVSIGGEVRFYINVPTRKSKIALEAHMYSEYPGVEIVEEEIDYTAEIPWDPDKYEYIAFHMGKKQAEEFPIKTYIDYGLDQMPKPEEKSDPMAPMIEILGKMNPQDRVWIQYLAVPHQAHSFKNGYLFSKPTWQASVQKKVDEIMNRNQKTSIDDETGERQKMLTPNEREKIAAMERNVGKYAYEVGIRWIYVAPKGKFNGDMINPILRTFGQYEIMNRNGLGTRWRTDLDYKFVPYFSEQKIIRWKRKELKNYKLREYYMRDYKGYADAPKVMSAEELATVWHLPNTTVVTPTLSRVTSTKKEAPSNLPTGQYRGI